MIPAHKQTDPDKKPGQVVYGFDRHPYMRHSTSDQTLGDYIARKTQNDAFNTVNAEKKLTFEEWYQRHGPYAMNLHPVDYAALIWKAAQENV